MRYSVLVVMTTFTASACAGAQRAAPGPTVSPSANTAGAVSAASLAELQTLLSADTVDDRAIAAYEFQVGSVYMDHVAEIVMDVRAPLLARVHGLEQIAMNETARQYEPVRMALHDADPRVRATALATANKLRNAGHRSYTRLLREALEDPAAEIQAKALQFVGDEDLSDLRRIAASDRPASVLSVANGILSVLEERGAPLVPDAAGVLSRTSATGHTLRFVPSHAWDQWAAAVGRVTVRTADNRDVEIPADIEAVASVVPVFFSASGEQVLYEANRRIHVMQLATGATRDVAPGIAPRIMPFTDAFVFLQSDPTGGSSDRGTTRLSYNVMRAAFAGGSQPEALGSLNVIMTQPEHGNYSPARWMTVAETDGTFYLTNGENVLFRLPSPFGTAPN